eukprot:TRINITY_DN24746_c1_g2_i1.p1 TRINITY_DN24746_c1_g2~~TRINITY_DN24746_c1_g2_i1.p1  ORF type:complete len:275 (-),score=46.58 TRINITY_DN24746_c1_g2_i1:124-948(-)
MTPFLQNKDLAGKAAHSFRQLARKIHPDGRPSLSEEDELRCHEALAKLQRARKFVVRRVGAEHRSAAPPRPINVRCIPQDLPDQGMAWIILWEILPSPMIQDQNLSHFELRARDGSFLVTLAEVELEKAEQGFRLMEKDLHSRLRYRLADEGRLSLWLAAVGGPCDSSRSKETLSEEISVVSPVSASSSKSSCGSSANNNNNSNNSNNSSNNSNNSNNSSNNSNNSNGKSNIGNNNYKGVNCSSGISSRNSNDSNSWEDMHTIYPIVLSELCVL